VKGIRVGYAGMNRGGKIRVGYAGMNGREHTKMNKAARRLKKMTTLRHPLHALQ
jgi:hypothetical protein